MNEVGDCEQGFRARASEFHFMSLWHEMRSGGLPCRVVQKKCWSLWLMSPP